MTVPSQADIKKRGDKLKEFMKKLNEDGSPQEKHVVAVVRSAIRSAWMKSDVKLAYLYSKTIPDMDESTRTKWLVKCEICGKLFKLTDIEIDHVHTGNTKFTKVEEFEQFFNNILMVNFDGLQILCKADHATKTYMDVHGVDWNEAICQKTAIDIIKQKKDRSWLSERGITPKSNAKLRREQIIEELRIQQNDLTNPESPD